MKRLNLATFSVVFTTVAAIAIGCGQDQPTSIATVPAAPAGLTVTQYDPALALSGTFVHASGATYAISFRAGETHRIEIAQDGRPVFEQVSGSDREVTELRLGGADVLAAIAGDAAQFAAVVEFTEGSAAADQLAEVLLAVLRQYDGDLVLVGPAGLGLQAADALVQPVAATSGGNQPYATPCGNFNYAKCLEDADTYWEVLNCGAWELVCRLAATA